MRTGLPALFFSICLLQIILLPTATQGQQFSEEQLKVLQSLNQEEAKQALEIAEKAVAWKTRLNKPDVEAQAVELVVSEAQALQTKYPKLAAAVDYANKLAPIIKQAEQAWKTAKYTAEEYEGFTEENFREQAKRRALEKANAELQKALETTILPQLEALRDPAAYVTGFAEGKLREWISQPVSLGDDSLQAKLIPPPAGTPLFAPTTEFGAEIVYMDDLKVTATGIQIQVQPGQKTPRININKMRVQSNVKGMVLNSVKSLGAEFASDSFPIKITLNGAPDFQPGMDGLRGGISFNVEISLFGGQVVKAKGENLVLYPGNRVDWKDASLLVAVRTKSPVPIGTTPFGMWKIAGKLNPRTKEISIGTQISTLAGDPDIVALEVALSTQVPVKSLTLEGHLTVARLKFMQTKGVIDFEKGEVSGEFKSSDANSPIAQLAFASGSFSLKRERFLADGDVKLFGKSFANMHCELNFADSSARLEASRGFKLFGADFGSSLVVDVSQGFKRLELECIQSMTVADIAPYGNIGVVVTVTADSDSPESIHVVAEAFGDQLRAEFDVPTLAGCTLGKLRQELQKQATAAYHRLLKSLAEGEADARKFGAKLDKKTRDYVDEKFGVTVKWGNEDLDRLGGDLSREFKNAGGAASDLREDIGGVLTGGREGLQQAGRDLEGGVRETLSNPGKALGSVFGG